MSLEQNVPGINDAVCPCCKVYTGPVSSMVIEEGQMCAYSPLSYA